MREVLIGECRISLELGDITRVSVDAIVNAANSGLRGGGGVDGAIHAAGGPAILAECRKISDCPTGEARLTTAGRLPAKYVIHAVGPVWHGGNQGEPEALASAYRHSLQLAEAKALRSIAFSAISTGVYGYPLDQAARIALQTTIDHVRHGTTMSEVKFVLFSDRALGGYEAALDAIVTGS